MKRSLEILLVSIFLTAAEAGTASAQEGPSTSGTPSESNRDFIGVGQVLYTFAIPPSENRESETGSMLLDPNGTYTLTYVFGGTYTAVNYGTYTRNGSAFTFYEPAFVGNGTGVLDGDNLTLTYDDYYDCGFDCIVVNVFTRQPRVAASSGGFENGTLPWSAFGVVNASISGSVTRTGSSSLAETGGNGGAYEDLSGLTPGAVYQVIAYARSAAGTTGQALLWVHDTAGGGAVYDGWRTPSSNGWDTYTVTFVAAANGRMRIHLIFSGGSGIVYWDDVGVIDASGFEDGAPAPWSAFGSVSAMVTTAASKTGISSLAETGGNGGAYQDIGGLTPGAVYQVIAYARSAADTTGQALLWVHDTVGGGAVYDGLRTPSSNVWDAYTVKFVAGANGRMRIHLVSSGGTGTIYWDDVRVTDAGGFETGAVSPWSAFGSGNASITTSVARTGTSSLVEAGNSVGVYQDLVGLTPGALYQVTAHAIAPPGTTAQALLWIHDTVGGGIVFDGWRTPSSNGWDAFTVTFIATASGRMRIHLMSSGGSGVIFWDDVHVDDAGGFENGVPVGWSAFGTVTTSITSSVARTGTSSLVESGDFGGISQDLVGLTPGAIYQISAYAHSAPGTTGQALIWVHDTVGGGAVYDGWRTPSSSGWEVYTVTFVATASGRIRIHLMFSGGSGAVFWDDVRVN